ncbi:ribonuclease HII [Cellulosilyticum sp. ST5]|uniref:ribonuclease HII n=1 Tax=unclassified Cellulosilyticum TaxID=2643091 RepID=UPI003977A811
MNLNIKELDQLLNNLSIESLKEELKAYEIDTRSGVIKLIDKYKRKIQTYENELALWQLKCEFDSIFHDNQYILVGIDEVGRGPLAGPVVAAAVILPYDTNLVGLKDSKKLTEPKREKLYDQIQSNALGIGIGIVDADRIDEINILQATFEAMRHALSELKMDYDRVLVDGDKVIPKIQIRQEAIIGGDDKSASIAAASVIAKVTRDRMMKAYANTYDKYDWENNKGYGSQKHYEAIRNYGITPLHRKSFLKNEGIF